ncbi:hypothetical protein ACI8AA_02315 [Geodermatophilus sp. SYSU D01180]
MSTMPADPWWVLQPLTDAGLASDQISDLVFRLAFDTVVAPGRLTPAHLGSLVDGQPVHVRRAWLEVLDRMTTESVG